MAAALVGSDQLAHLRINKVGHGLPEDPLADLVDVLGQPPLGRPHRARDHVLELVPTQPVFHRELHHLQELGRADLPAAQPVPGDGGDGEPGDQRPVQVEERADARSRRARVDLGHGARQAQWGIHEVPSGERDLGTERAGGRPSSTISSNPA